MSQWQPMFALFGWRWAQQPLGEWLAHVVCNRPHSTHCNCQTNSCVLGPACLIDIVLWRVLMGAVVCFCHWPHCPKLLGQVLVLCNPINPAAVPSTGSVLNDPGAASIIHLT